MKLFISYSRDDKAWVYELWRNLRDRAHHDAWIDQRIIPAQDWWDSILTNIETAECVLYIMTPKSVDSIYCQAEMTYALALNKPILPLMLKPCDVPAEISRRRIQHFSLSDTDSLGDVLFTIERGLSQLRVDTLQGKFQPPTPYPARPAEPSRPKKPEQVSEIFQAAADAADENNYSLAERLYKQARKADPDNYGMAASRHLGQIRQKRHRDQNLQVIIQMSEIPAQLDNARDQLEDFVERYGSHGVPDELRARLALDIVRQLKPLSTSTEPAAGTRMTDSQGIPMVYVPAGKFLMGSTPQQVEEIFQQAKKHYFGAKREWYEGQMPQHEQIIKQGFWLDLTPVTTEAYARFVAAGGYQTPTYWLDAGWAWLKKEKRSTPNDYDGFTNPRQPRVGVTWFEACAYCKWRGGRLPTEAEWEWAARRPENRVYPWGDTFDASRVIYHKNSDGKTALVGERVRQTGASWVGALDMSGNVYELCSSLGREYPFRIDDGREYRLDAISHRMMRGGSWLNFGIDSLRCDNRTGTGPRGRSNYKGFRCILS